MIERKRRTDRVRRADRSVEKRVHTGKGYAKVRRVDPRRCGKRWGEFVGTHKPRVKRRVKKAGKIKGQR